MGDFFLGVVFRRGILSRGVLSFPLASHGSRTSWVVFIVRSFGANTPVTWGTNGDVDAFIPVLLLLQTRVHQLKL